MPDEGSFVPSWGAGVRVTFRWLALPAVVAIEVGHLGDTRVLATLWRDPPTSAGAGASHLGVLMCPRGGMCGVSLHVCLVVSVAFFGEGTNIFRLIVMAKLGLRNQI